MLRSLEVPPVLYSKLTGVGTCDLHYLVSVICTLVSIQWAFRVCGCHGAEGERVALDTGYLKVLFMSLGPCPSELLALSPRSSVNLIIKINLLILQ